MTVSAIRLNINAEEAERLVNKAVREFFGCSDVTRALITQLAQRDAHGRQKYGTTLDRPDLSLTDWLQHQAEELMDGAGYALAAKREAERLQAVERAARVLLAEVQRLDASLPPALGTARDELRIALGQASTQTPDS